MAFVNHISVRVPWHGDQWRGTVCKKPRENAACIALPEIGAKKMDDAEECVAGRRFDELSESELPPCVRERVSFMAPFALRPSSKSKNSPPLPQRIDIFRMRPSDSNFLIVVIFSRPGQSSCLIMTHEGCASTIWRSTSGANTT